MFKKTITKKGKTTSNTILLTILLLGIFSHWLPAQELHQSVRLKENVLASKHEVSGKILPLARPQPGHVLCDSVHADSILVNDNGNCIFSFQAVNPQNVTGFKWDLGDGSPSFAGSQSISHAYNVSGTYHVILYLSNGCSSDTLYTTVSCTDSGTNISNVNSHKLNFSFYPNPAAGILNISYSASSLQQMQGVAEISDLSGRRINAMPLPFSPGDHVLQFDIRKLVPGMYFLTLRNGQKRSVEKFVKQ